MPQSRTRTSRQATRAKYRKPKRRRSGSMGWNVAIAAVVVIGIVAIVLTRGGGESVAGGPPFAANQATGQPGSHWHTGLGVNICGEWLSAQPVFEGVGIHTHGDGLIHTHPFVSSEEGGNATLGKYADNADWSVSSDSIDAWTGPESKQNQTSWSNGDTCTFGEFEGKEGRIVWAVDGKERTGNPADYRMKDGETIAIGFLPEGAELGFPPDTCDAFATISDQNTPAVVSKNSPCRTEATTTTAPSDTTTTTAAPSG